MIKGVLLVAGLALAGGLWFLWFVGGQALEKEAAGEDLTAVKGTLVTNPLINQTPSIKYQSSDLELIEGETKAQLLVYGQKLGEAMRAYQNAPLENETKLLLRVIENQDSAALEQLRRAGEKHRAAAAGLLTMLVPISAADVHLNLINALVGMAELNFYMSQALSEPAVALESARYHPFRLSTFLETVNQINKYFKDRGVKFGEGENVRILMD